MSYAMLVALHSPPPPTKLHSKAQPEDHFVLVDSDTKGPEPLMALGWDLIFPELGRGIKT